MNRPAPARRSPASSLGAIALGALAGLVQAAIFVGYLGSTRPETSQGADRGFGGNPSIGLELGWLLGFLVASVVLVTVSLAVLRIRWYGLVMPVVLAVEFGVGGWLGSMLAGHSDWRSLVLVAVLAVELLLCQLLLPVRPRD